MMENNISIMIHDLDESFNEQLKTVYENVIWADGKYAPCQGCFECWTKNLEWCGGLGIGGGVMMNVMRIMIGVFLGITILKLIITGINTGNFMEMSYIYGFLENLAVVLLLGSGIIIFDMGLAFCIKRKKAYGKHYTRIMLPAFLFIICAEICFS